MPRLQEDWSAEFATYNGFVFTGTGGFSVCQLRDGSLWIVWQQLNDDGAGVSPGADIVGQRIDALGVPIGNPVRLNTSSFNSNETLQQVAADPGGTGFLLIYQAEAGPPESPFFNLIVERKNADGSPNGALTVALDPTGDSSGINFSNPNFAVASATNGLVTYTREDGSGSFTYAQFFNPSTMQLIGAAFPLLGVNRSITVLANGNYVTDGRIVDQSGATVGAYGSPSTSQIAALTGGGFVSVFSQSGSNGPRTFVTVHEADGTVVTSFQFANPGANDPLQFLSPSVAATDDGGFLVSASAFGEGVYYTNAYNVGPGGVSVAASGAGFGRGLLLEDGRHFTMSRTSEGITGQFLDARTGPGAVSHYEPISRQFGTPRADTFTTEPSGADYVHGGRGDDTITEGLGVDGVIDGGEGNDTIILRVADGLEAGVDGGNGTDTLQIDDFVAPATVNLLSGTVSSNGQISSFTNIEHFTTASNLAMTIVGSGLPNVITTGGGTDFIDLRSGGPDRVSAGGGNDGIYLGAAMDSGDQIDGGAGTSDQIGLQGNYAGLTFGANATIGVEFVVLLPGNDNRFGGATGTNLSYTITTRDENIAAGQVLAFQANTLRTGENFTLNGSAETNGSFLTFGGQGIDNLTGGQADDGFYFGTGRFTAGDTLNGQGGSDQLGLQGNYAGASALVLGGSQLTSIEFIVLLSASDTRFGGGSAGQSFSYTLTMNNGNVAAGQRMIIQANTLKSAEVLTFNGAAEEDGSFQLFGGAGADSIVGSAQADELGGGAGTDRIEGLGGADVLRGGAGSDRFFYAAASHSPTAARDRVLDFASGDLFDFSALDGNSLAAGIQNFYLINSNAAFSGAGQLRITQTATSALIEGDSNGDGLADFAIEVTVTDGHTLTRTGDFVGVDAPPVVIGSLPLAHDTITETYGWGVGRNPLLDQHLSDAYFVL